jgi:hypothetical protein
MPVVKRMTVTGYALLFCDAVSELIASPQDPDTHLLLPAFRVRGGCGRVETGKPPMIRPAGGNDGVAEKTVACTW